MILWTARAAASVLLLALTAPAAFGQPDERTIYASVVDRNGAPVLDLTARDFIVREDGVAREVLRVAKDDDPLQVALLVDNSTEMRSRLPQLRKAAAAFVSATRGGVPIAFVTLAERPTIVVGYTTDRKQLLQAIERMFSFDAGNYLLDGIAETSQTLSKRPMWRSAIAVITGLGPELSYRQYTEVLRFFREGGASLHVLQLGTGIGAQGREIVISRGTAETGGRFEQVLTPAALELKAEQLAAEISNQYRVTYARPPRLIPPEKIEVSVRRPNLRTRSRPLQTER